MPESLDRELDQNFRRQRLTKHFALAVVLLAASASVVVPEFEQVLSSPVNARVLKILKRPGALLAAIV